MHVCLKYNLYKNIDRLLIRFFFYHGRYESITELGSITQSMKQKGINETNSKT